MPDSVFFDGSDDKMVFGIGNADIPAGPITIALVMKDNSFTEGNFDALLVTEDGGTTRWWSAYLYGFGGSNFMLGTTAGDQTGPSAVDLEGLGLTGEWVILAVTKANGSVAPRFHRFDGTFGWDHGDAGAALANGTTPPGTAKLQVGLDSLFGSPADVNMLIFGIKDSVMSDAEIEELADGYAAWLAAGFVEGVRLDAVSGLTSFVPGGAMSLESVTGAVVDSGDAPAWWVEGGLYTIVNGSDETLTNVNADGTDISPGAYKDGVSLTESELAALLTLGQKDVAVFADLTGDAQARQRKLATLKIPHMESA